MRGPGFEPGSSGWKPEILPLNYPRMLLILIILNFFKCCEKKIKMRNKGFEPLQALSHESLNLARLTTPAIPRKKFNLKEYKSFYKRIILIFFNPTISFFL